MQGTTMQQIGRDLTFSVLPKDTLTCTQEELHGIRTATVAHSIAALFDRCISSRLHNLFRITSWYDSKC